MYSYMPKKAKQSSDDWLEVQQKPAVLSFSLYLKELNFLLSQLQKPMQNLQVF